MQPLCVGRGSTNGSSWWGVFVASNLNLIVGDKALSATIHLSNLHNCISTKMLYNWLWLWQREASTSTTEKSQSRNCDVEEKAAITKSKRCNGPINWIYASFAGWGPVAECTRTIDPRIACHGSRRLKPGRDWLGYPHRALSRSQEKGIDSGLATHV